MSIVFNKIIYKKNIIRNVQKIYIFKALKKIHTKIVNPNILT